MFQWLRTLKHWLCDTEPEPSNSVGATSVTMATQGFISSPIPQPTCYCACHSKAASRSLCIHCKPEAFRYMRDPYWETYEQFRERVKRQEGMEPEPPYQQTSSDLLIQQILEDEVVTSSLVYTDSPSDDVFQPPDQDSPMFDGFGGGDSGGGGASDSWSDSSSSSDSYDSSSSDFSSGSSDY